MELEEKFEYPFADSLMFADELTAVPKIRGMREWINAESDILFVAQQLPEEGDGKPLFGPKTLKIFHSLFEAGLLEETYDTPWDAEVGVFGMQGFSDMHLWERYPWSIVSWSHIPMYKEPVFLKGKWRRYGICIADWERILDMLEPLGVKKVAVLGKKMIREANGWMKGDRDSPAEYGFLWNHEHKGYSVPFYGLPITKLNDEAVAYYQILKEGVLF